MDAWLIVLITISSGIALFAIIFALKNRSEKKRAQMNENRMTTVHVVQSQPYPQQQMQNVPPPYSPGFIQQSHQGQTFVIHPPIPSTANQGLVNPRNPQDYRSNMSNHGRFIPILAPTTGMP